MTQFPEGRAIIYCQDAFGTTNGKTANGLVRRTRRYEIIAVVDSRHAGADAGQVLDGRANGITVVADLAQALCVAARSGGKATHFVIGLAPDGGRLDPRAREAVREAIAAGLNVDCGLHDFLSDDADISRAATARGVQIRDVRKTPDRSKLHFFAGKINDVQSVKVAALGTDSAVGKRTTAWALVDGFRNAGLTAELVGTGQTAWMQGARYCIILDSLINDFVAGELEHAVWSAWNDTHCDVIVIEGQGSLMHPAYPGGFEILAACRPDAIVMQHAPARREYDGFPGYAIAPLEKQIEAVELISGKPVVGITVNHENVGADEVDSACDAIAVSTELPVCDILIHGPEKIVAALLAHSALQRRPT